MAENVVAVTDANFAQLTGNGVALVDFWAERCPPCRMQGPIIDKLAKMFANRATIGKLDVDSNSRVTVEFGLHSIPTLILFKDGKELKRLIGLQSEKILVSILEKALESQEESGDTRP